MRPSTKLLSVAHESNDILSIAKKRVRPNWSLEKWAEREFQFQQWPDARNDDGMKSLLCQPLTSRSEWKSRALDQGWNWDHPCRFSQNLSTEWPHVEAFAIEHLLENYGDLELCVGSDDIDTDNICESDSYDKNLDGEDIMIPLNEYISYADRDADGDDAPLYVFDDWILSGVGEAADCPLREAYSIPHPFQQYDYMSEWPGGLEERPPFCWILIGAKRSGTALHVDPTSTAAWNTLVSGRKRWILLPPELHRTPSSNQPEDFQETHGIIQDLKGKVPDSVTHWFHDVYPYLSQGYLRGGYDFVQLPGETVYVPNGWRHCVVNLEMSVAITHNFVGKHNVNQALKNLQKTDEIIAQEWKNNLLRKGLLDHS